MRNASTLTVHRADGHVRWTRAGIALILACVNSPTNAAVDTSIVLQEVIVTATRRPTRSLDTPISMTVLGADTLRTANADAFSDFASHVPGLTAIDTGPGQKRYALRGLQSAGEPQVALYYDEIPISGLPGSSLDTGDSQPDIKLWDVERVEVLRGPQGTLYGNGSMGGAIRIISKRPVLDRVEGALEASSAFTSDGAGSWRMNAMLNTPVIDDRLAIRIAAYYRDEGGWLDNHSLDDVALPQVDGNNLNTERTWGTRASMTFQATERWTLTGIAYYQNLKTGDSFETYPTFATSTDRYVSQAFVRTPWIDESQMFNLISTYRLDWADLVVTGSYQRRTADINLDSTRFLLSFSGCTEYTWNKTCFGPANVPADSSAHQGVSATSAELRLVSTTDGKLEWTLGAFAQDANTFRRGQLAMTNAAGYIDYDPATGDAVNRLFARTNHDTFDQRAVFGEATYDIAAHWKATLGLRWFHSYRSDQQVLVQQFFPDAPVGPQPFQDFRESELFKKFQLAYGFTDGGLLYAQAAQGFRAGGPNYPGGFALTAPPYAADSIWNYELGWKLQLANPRVEWTGAIFRIDWSDVQQLLPVQIFSSIVNGGDARSNGFESELSAALAGGFAFNIGASFADAHLVGPQPVVTNPNLQLQDGDRLAGVPKWTANAGLSYEHPLGSNLLLRSRLDYSYLSSRGNIVNPRSATYFVIDGAGLTNLHFALERGDGWMAALHIYNALNEFVPVSGKMEDANLIQAVTAARPRTVSLNLSKDF
jgi:outer membrane receptor protein involved in Fe transport